MLSWLYLIQGIGMIAVGAIVIVYWHMKKHVGFKFFLYGAILWAVAIAIKVAMDLTITQPLNSALLSVLPVVAVLAIMSLYFGLRTGILESGITYLVVKNSKLSRSTFDGTIALGIGFGGTEAILLGIYSLYSTFMLLQSYEILGPVPLFSLDWQALLAIPIPIAERIFMLVCHVFATALVIYAVKLKDLKWLYVSITYKTIIDDTILPFKYYLGYTTIYEYWLVELFYGVLAIIGLIGLYWIKERYGGYAPEEGSAGIIGAPH